MSNIDKAIEVLDWLDHEFDYSDGPWPDNETVVKALADAGLIAPESEQTVFEHNPQDYLTREIYVRRGRVCFKAGFTMREEIDYEDLTPDMAREFAGRLIAAANYAETEKLGEQ